MEIVELGLEFGPLPVVVGLGGKRRPRAEDVVDIADVEEEGGVELFVDAFFVDGEEGGSVGRCRRGAHGGPVKLFERHVSKSEDIVAHNESEGMLDGVHRERCVTGCAVFPEVAGNRGEA